MTELLAPAGNMDALKAAISNGADAIYLGMNKFGARAYANNFDIEELKEAVKYAHLRNVKIYVTMNTIVFDNELSDAYKQIKELYLAGVDGVIVQDLAIFTHITENYLDMEAHCSTQMGIDDLEGTLLFKSLGAKRVVLSREVPIDKIRMIKKEAKIPIEIFVHGALCVSYSGNCLMSGLIGYRSGNRGRCVGSCRKPYELINTTTGEVLSNSYILSMKDLNTIKNIDELRCADSLKIEGRMKESVYVANVINSYRKALDNKVTTEDIKNLEKTFNRTFTKGYIFGEDKKNITNILKPNNFGFKIGYISKKTPIGYEITLSKELNQNDIIRIDHNNTDVNLTVAKMYDKDDNLISSSINKCYIKIKEDLAIGDSVYKTKDIKFHNYLESTYPKEFKRFTITMYVYGAVGSNLSITLECDGKSVYVESDFLLEEAVNRPTDKAQFCKQFDRLNDTVYKLGNVDYMVDGVFIPAAKINELRRLAIDALDNERLLKRDEIKLHDIKYDNISFENKNPLLSVYCSTLEQYNAAKDLGINTIYYDDNIIRRNETIYPKTNKELLIGGYGGIYAYKDSNEFSTDYSLNCVNYKSVYMLHKLGAKRVCLSYEMNLDQINDLITDYNKYIGGNPNLEMIVYGKAPMMFTTYCPLKVFNQCGKCKQNEYIIKDEYGSFPIESHKDCTTTLLNGKNLNLIDDLENIKGINTFRIQLTKESYDEAVNIINMFKDKLNNMKPTKLFNKETDTRGHFNKEIL